MALAALAATGIAGADYMKSSVHAFKLAISGFIIPYLVIYNPIVVLRPDNWLWAAGSLIAIPLGMTALTAALYGCGLVPFNTRERIAAIACAVCMFAYSTLRALGQETLQYIALGTGVVIFATVLVEQLKKRKSGRAARLAARIAPS